MATPTSNALPSPLLVGGRLCLDFCNTVEYHDTDQRLDMLRGGYPRLIWWSKALDLIDEGQLERLLQLNDTHPDQTRIVFDQATSLREPLYQIFVATIAKTAPSPAWLQVLNDVVQQANDHRELVGRESVGLSWRWRDQDAPEAMLWPIALSAVDLLISDDLDRVRQCPSCGWLFFDQSRNRSRTWCDMQYCGNRSKARRFYQRQKSAE
jgi:predicted RNA-binding Zn ribbon-like protein